MTKRHPAQRRRDLLARSRLYLILDPATCPGKDGLERIGSAIGPEGVEVVQVRWKGAERAAVATFVEELRTVTGPDCLILVNDDPEAAVLADADGVHVGRTDPPPATVREIVGPDRLIGLSTHSPAQFREGLKAGADYLAIGAMFSTGTKRNAEVIGPDCLREIGATAAAAAEPPIWFAIGGIGPANVARLTRDGCPRAAVSAAIVNAIDPGDVAKRLRDALAAVPLP